METTSRDRKEGESVSPRPKDTGAGTSPEAPSAADGPRQVIGRFLGDPAGPNGVPSSVPAAVHAVLDTW